MVFGALQRQADCYLEVRPWRILSGGVQMCSDSHLHATVRVFLLPSRGLQLMHPLAERLTRATRRRLLACAAAIIFALPAEAALLAMIGPRSNDEAARDWAESLSDDSLQDAAQRIQEYPYFYRRAIMTALEPDERAATWRKYLSGYAATHSLDPASRAVIGRAIAAMTPEVFDDGAPADQLAELSAVFEIGVGLFGRRTAIDLFMRLGPDDGAVDAFGAMAALPAAERLGARLRGYLSASANAQDCDCTTAFGASCDVSGFTGAEVCAAASGCDPDVSWPMSGVAWAFPANGVCSTLGSTADAGGPGGR